MEPVAIVIVLALIQYQAFGFLVGRARGKYNCPAPATTGDPVFERYYRVHGNTGEQLIVFLPAIVIYGYYGNPQIAAAAGVIFLAGRQVYLLAYVKDPAKRSLGFMIGFVPMVFLLLAGALAAARALVA